MGIQRCQNHEPVRLLVPLLELNPPSENDQKEQCFFEALTVKFNFFVRAWCNNQCTTRLATASILTTESFPDSAPVKTLFTFWKKAVDNFAVGADPPQEKWCRPSCGPPIKRIVAHFRTRQWV